MIQINKDYYIGGEEKNLIIYKAKVGQEGKSKGQVRYEEVAYPGSISLLLKSLTRRKIKLAVGDSQSFEELNTKVDAIYRMVDDFCSEYGIKILQELKEKANDEGINGSDQAVSI